MDAQLKRGMIEACVLSMLTKGDSYGYELIKEIMPVLDVSESTLYPVLRRLEAAKSLTVYSVEHNSRLRRYYSITDEGRKRLADFVAEWHQINKVYEFITGHHDPA